MLFSAFASAMKSKSC